MKCVVEEIIVFVSWLGLTLPLLRGSLCSFFLEVHRVSTLPVLS